MSNSKWFAFKLWLAQAIERILPDSVRRQVLYRLSGRVAVATGDGPGFDEWKVTFQQLYDVLTD